MGDSGKRPAEILSHPGAPSDITSQDVTQFKQPRGKRPRFVHLPWLSTALGHDPSYLARELGMVPQVEEDLVRAGIAAARRLSELEEQSAALERSMYRRSADVIATIVARANETGRWAVAVWPAVEGPPDCRMHVAERLDFSRTDGRTAIPEDLREDLGGALEAANAIPSTAQPRWAADPQPGMSWTIQTALETRAPSVHIPHNKVRSVCVVAHSVTSWASDTASNLALILGYGLDSTRALKVKVYGGERTVQSGEARGEDVASMRSRIHGNLLLDPKSRHVWYHFGNAADGAPFFPASDAPWPYGLFVVRMRETDSLLEWAHRKKSRYEFISALRERDAADRLWPDLPQESVLSLDVDHAQRDDGQALTEIERRDRRRMQSVVAAADIVETLLSRGLITKSSITDRLAALCGPSATNNERVIGAWLQARGRSTVRD